MASSEPRTHTFLFAHLAGFTAAHGGTRGRVSGGLVGAFCEAARGLAPEHDAEEV